MVMMCCLLILGAVGFAVYVAIFGMPGSSSAAEPAPAKDETVVTDGGRGLAQAIAMRVGRRLLSLSL